jgi:sec-independent protein translocase protein TatA
MSLGMPEIIIIFFIILLLFGAKKLPELAKGLGKGLKEFKQATREPEIDEENSEIESAEKKK